MVISFTSCVVGRGAAQQLRGLVVKGVVVCLGSHVGGLGHGVWSHGVSFEVVVVVAAAVSGRPNAKRQWMQPNLIACLLGWGGRLLILFLPLTLHLSSYYPNT